MNNFLFFFFAFLLINKSNVAFAKVSGDDGWSSSGGGEYIITQYNPWFMGPTPVKWCVDHGGPEQFSLSFELAKKEVTNGLQFLVSQLKRANTNQSEIPRYFLGLGDNGMHHRKAQTFENESLFITDNYIYTDNCNEADLEVILGNVTNPKIAQLIGEIGEIKFQHLSGVAMRTSYSQENLRGKGFIYLAADKGNMQYRGARNIKFSNETIWDAPYEYLLSIPLPEGFAFADYSSPYYEEKVLLKDLIIGNVQAVFTHEFGHVLGFKHNNYSNIMDIDYPAKVIANGLTFQGNYIRSASLFTQGLIESDIPRAIQYEWDYARAGRYTHKEINSKSKDIANFLYAFKEFNLDDRYPHLSFVFNFPALGEDPNDPKDLNRKKASLTLYTLVNDLPKLKKMANYEIELATSCKQPVHIDDITVRTHQTNVRDGVKFDKKTNQWINVDNKQIETIVTSKLFIFENTYFCGRIKIKSTPSKYIDFQLAHNYFKDTSRLTLIDSKNYNFHLWLQQGVQAQKGTNFETLKLSPLIHILDEEVTF